MVSKLSAWTAKERDLVATKEIQAGGQSKWARPLHDWPLGKWKVGGHAPVLAVVKPISHWMRPARKAKHTCEAQQLQRTLGKEKQQASCLKELLRGRMPVDHPDQCNQTLLNAVRLVPPKERQAGFREPDSSKIWQFAKKIKEVLAQLS